METASGKVVSQYGNDGREQTWKGLEDVVRVSFIPVVPLLPRHDCLIDIAGGERFVKRFGKGFIRQTKDGFRTVEYVNCCMTERYRFWVFHSSGKALVTSPDFEVRI